MASGWGTSLSISRSSPRPSPRGLVHPPLVRLHSPQGPASLTSRVLNCYRLGCQSWLSLPERTKHSPRHVRARVAAGSSSSSSSLSRQLESACERTAATPNILGWQQQRKRQRLWRAVERSSASSSARDIRLGFVASARFGPARSPVERVVATSRHHARLRSSRQRRRLGHVVVVFCPSCNSRAANSRRLDKLSLPATCFWWYFELETDS